MYKKTITYEDYDGNKRTEDFYFNLSRAEVMKWLTQSGDYTLDKVFKRIVEKRNGKEVMNIFENLIYMAYGEKSLDGRRFEKTDEVKRNFMETEAFSKLFIEIITDAHAAAEFVNGIIPKEMQDSIEQYMKENPEGIPAEIADYKPVS